MEKPNLRLGEILVKQGLIREGVLEQALQEQKSTGEFLGRILLRKKYINEDQLADALSLQFGMPRVSLKDRYIDWELVGRFSGALILESRCFPLSREEGRLIFVTVNPLDAVAMRKAQQEAGAEDVAFVLAVESEMDLLLERYRKQVKSRIRNLLDE